MAGVFVVEIKRSTIEVEVICSLEKLVSAS